MNRSSPSSSPANAAPAPSAQGAAPRVFGRFELRQLVGKSRRSMAWRVFDPRVGQELVLFMPRVQPVDAEVAEAWQARVKQAGRLNHPALAPVFDQGEQDRWPYVAYELTQAAVLSASEMSAVSARDAAAWMSQAADGLAFAHEAGVAHRDLQPFSFLLTASGDIQLMGLEVAMDQPTGLSDAHHLHPAFDQGATQMHQGTDERRAHQLAAQRDVLAVGLVLHQILAGHPALDEADLGAVIERLPPQGHDIIRLPFGMARTVSDALRAIVNRATDRQPRQRYLNARTLARALEGWLEVDEEQDGDPLALVLDRLRTHGALPAAPGASSRLTGMAAMEKGRTSELAQIVLRDLGLSFELLRMVNTAQVRGSQISGNGPVLTLRRAIAMVGLDGVRRAGNALRPWPGPLNPQGATALEALIERVKRAAKTAQLLRPAGYDEEVVYVVAVLQNLGRLIVQYHFPEEANQIRRLMQPAPAERLGDPDEPGMTEEAASFAVMGAGIEAIGVAVARYWGLDESVQTMMRRISLERTPHLGDGDDEQMRAVASAANEAVDAQGLPAKQAHHALERVVQRYGRALLFTLRDVQLALQGITPEEEAERKRAAQTATAPAAPAPAPAAQPTAPVPTPGAPPTAGRLRAKAAAAALPPELPPARDNSTRLRARAAAAADKSRRT